MQEWGFVFTTDPNEETAIIIGAALLGALLVYFAVTYIVLRYAKKPGDGGEPPRDQEKVKKEVIAGLNSLKIKKEHKIILRCSDETRKDIFRKK